ncbi:uncharacterized protein LOC113324863 [Papaver somniferum]|uniref:uncharacterized protein LOC113324863 n=1 Tax=Papaver somniferum TaxID=3469 RepID=UPI000E703BC1|nr:uncharacterized protein LOC113324863 [Papaver somniferum]
MGSPAFRHTKSLSTTKHELRDWNYNIFGNISTKIIRLESTLQNLLNANNAPNSVVVVLEVQSKLKHWHDIEEDFWRQRGKEEAFKFGERNTAYFHNKTNFRRKRTQIETIQNEMGIWLTEREEIAANLKSHFFKMSRTARPPNVGSYLDHIVPCITAEDKNMLNSIPSHEEVKNVVFSMQPWTTPVPDGFPPGFYHEMWSTLGDDTVSMVRLITDNIVIAHELIDSMKHCKAEKGWMAIKLDMSKAFDRIEWSFLLETLTKLGFDEDFCSMIHQCLSTVSTSIMLNGSPGDIFTPQRA